MVLDDYIRVSSFCGVKRDCAIPFFMSRDKRRKFCLTQRPAIFSFQQTRVSVMLRAYTDTPVTGNKDHNSPGLFQPVVRRVFIFALRALPWPSGSELVIENFPPLPAVAISCPLRSTLAVFLIGLFEHIPGKIGVCELSVAVGHGVASDGKLKTSTHLVPKSLDDKQRSNCAYQYSARVFQKVWAYLHHAFAEVFVAVYKRGFAVGITQIMLVAAVFEKQIRNHIDLSFRTTPIFYMGLYKGKDPPGSRHERDHRVFRAARLQAAICRPGNRRPYRAVSKQLVPLRESAGWGGISP